MQSTFNRKNFNNILLVICFLIGGNFSFVSFAELKFQPKNITLASKPQFLEGITANHDLIRMNKCTTDSIDVLQNDLGLTSGIKSLTIIKAPKYGKAEFGKDHRLHYTPNLYYVGEDYLEYEVCNNSGSCGQAGVGITVNDFDYQPIAVDDYVELEQGKYEIVNVLANDLYLYDLEIHLEILSQPENGSASITQDQKINLVIDKFILNRDSLIYRVCDGDGDCAIGTLWITLSNSFDNSYIPQGFSPNGDGINDIFNIPSFEQFVPLKIMIMDRNGRLVFTSDEYDNKWDGYANAGTYNGELLPAGIYYYKLTVPYISKEITGYIYLNR